MNEQHVMNAKEAVAKLMAANVPWRTILAALVQGLPALLALIAQIFGPVVPPAPPKP